MRMPAVALSGGLMWSRWGTVWATWRLRGLPYGLGTDEMKGAVLASHQALIQSLRGEALLMGLCASTDPADIVDRMLDGVDLHESLGWAEETALTLDSLEEVPLGERAFWLSIPLAAGNWKARAFAALRAGDSFVREQFALPRSLPTKAEIAEAMQAADLIQQKIPKVFQPRPATPAQHVWMALHAQQRGLYTDGAVPGENEQPGIDGVPATQPPTAMPRPWIDEGGQSDLTRNSIRRHVPFNRRYLKVQSSHMDSAPSYQVTQALVGSPKAGWQVPGVEWISRVDHYGIDVDWAIRMQISSAEVVKRRNKRAEEQLVDQEKQQSGTLAITGSGSELDEVAETLAAYQRSLNSSDREVEVQGTIMYTVAAPSPELAVEQARFVAADFKASDFLLEAPLGGQEELWWAMQPGIPTSRIVRELSQITTGREFASGLPIVTSALGDERGIRIADNTTTGRHTPCLLDLYGSIAADASGSFGIVAELGAGKSVLLKIVAGSVVDRGGRIVVIDRTHLREYAIFAKSLPQASTRIVDILAPEWSLDPLRVFGPAQGARMVQSLFSMLLNLNSFDDEGIALSEILAPDYMTEHGIRSLGTLVAHLQTIADQDPIAKKLLRLIRVVSTKDIGRVLFDETLPPLDLNAEAIVFCTHGMELPDKEQVEQEHLFKQLTIDQVFGRAMYAQLVQIAREVCFADPSQLAVAFFDECHHITASRDGQDELRTFFRDGRKHGAAAAVASHDPEDFGDERTRGLIKIRFVMRQTDETLAKRAIKWLGLPVEPETVATITSDTSPMGPDGTVPMDRRGEAIMRDVRGRYGRIRTILPHRPERRLAVLSTPSKKPEEATA